MAVDIPGKEGAYFLYEGYALYPYRPSSIKNRQRWNFGVLYPESWAASQVGSDRWFFRMEILARAGALTELDLTVRHKHYRNAFHETPEPR